MYHCERKPVSAPINFSPLIYAPATPSISQRESFSLAQNLPSSASCSNERANETRARKRDSRFSLLLLLPLRPAPTPAPASSPTFVSAHAFHSLSFSLRARYCLYVLLQIFSLRQTFVHLKSASPYFLDASRVYAFLLRERPTGQPGSFAETFSQLLCFPPLLLSHGFQDFRWFAQTRSIVQQSAINARTINRLMIERTVPMLMLGSHDVFDRRFNRSSWR